MGNSYAIQKNVTCKSCGASTNFDVWQIVDAEERPDLIEKIKNGILHDAYCPQCNKLIIQIDSPLLVCRQDNDPVFLYSKSEETTESQDNKILQNLLLRLKQSLGSNWPKDWKDRFPPPLPSRTVMPIFFREGGQAAVMALIQYQKQNIETTKKIG